MEKYEKPSDVYIIDKVTKKLIYKKERRKEYTEIKKLRKLFKQAGYKTKFRHFLDGYQILVPEYDFDVIEHWGSYGHEDDLLEIMGLYTEEECGGDSVKGYLTAQEIFDKFQKVHGND